MCLFYFSISTFIYTTETTELWRGLTLRCQAVDERDAADDPVRGQPVGGKPDEHDEVGRVAGGGERAAARGGAVDGAVIVRVGGEVVRLDRLELDVGHGAEEHLRYPRGGAGQHRKVGPEPENLGRYVCAACTACEKACKLSKHPPSPASRAGADLPTNIGRTR